MRESVSAQWTLACTSLSPFIPIVRKRVPSLQFSGRGVCVCEWENKQQTTNSTSYICLQLERFFTLTSPQASLLRAVFTLSPAELRGRVPSSPNEAPQRCCFTSTRVQHRWTRIIWGLQSDITVVIVFFFCKMSGGEIICQGWLRKSPPEKKLRRYVSVSNAMFFCVRILCFVYSNSDAESRA